MATLPAAVSELCEDYLVRPESVLGAYAQRAIRNAIESYATERLGFNEREFSIPIWYSTAPPTLAQIAWYNRASIVNSYETGYSQGQPLDPSLPQGGEGNVSDISYSYTNYVSTILSIDHVDMEKEDTARRRLIPVTWQEMLHMRGDGNATTEERPGVPTRWCLFSDTLRFDSFPNQTLTAVIWCHIQLPEILDTDSVQTNEWLQEGKDLILASAARRLAQTRLRDYEAARSFAEMERDALAKLRERGRLRTSTGLLRGEW